MRRLGAALLAILLLSLLPVVVGAQVESVIQGQLVNKTPQGSSVADVPVTLKTSVAGKEGASAQASSDAQGRFRFAGLATGTDYTYQITLTYQEAEYSSESIQFAAGETLKSVEIPVWDATASDEAISIERLHAGVRFEGDGLVVTEYYVFLNQGDKAYVGSKLVPSLNKKETLRFSLPRGAQVQELALGLMDCCVAASPDGLVDTMAMEPGAKEIAFAYILKYTGSQYVFDKVADYPTDNFLLVVEDRGIQVASPELTPMGSLKMGDQPVMAFARQNIARGTALRVTFSGLPHPSPLQSLRWVGLSLLVGGLAFGLGYPMLKKRPAPVPVQDDREKLLLEIAKMDDAFEAGKLEKETYYRERSQKMARLMRLTRQARKES